PESIGEAAAVESFGKAAVSELVVLEAFKNAFVLCTGGELEFAELHGLKSAGRVELVAKFEKPDRSHSLENVDLGDEDLFDPDDRAEAVIGTECTALFKPGDGGVELVEDLFEPKFVRLVDDYKEQLVMAEGVGKRLLQPDKLGNFEIFVIGERCAFAVFGSHFDS